MPGFKWKTEAYGLFLEDDRFYPTKQQLKGGFCHCVKLSQQAASEQAVAKKIVQTLGFHEKVSVRNRKSLLHPVGRLLVSC